MELLRLHLDPLTTKDYTKLLTLQQGAATSVLSLFGRINGGALRGGGQDRMGELLDAVKRAEQG